MNSNCVFSHSIRDALLRDERLVQLLGGTNVFEGYETELSTPHINICESAANDDYLGHGLEDKAIITLQVWSHSGEKTRAQKLIEAAENALARAGLMKPGATIMLQRNFSAARKLPEIGEFQGILRYHAERHSDAA